MKKIWRNARTGPAKYVRIMKKLFVLCAAVEVVALMVLLALAFGTKGTPQVVYGCLAAAVGILFFVAYGFYALNVSMGTIVSLEVTEKVVHLTTNRKVFTYDAKRGCVRVRKKHGKFVCTFETQNTRDSFVFFTRAPFSSFSDTQFTEDDVRAFCPRFDELIEE